MMILSKMENYLISVTEFRNKLSAIISTLTTPKIIMKNDKPTIVIMPFEIYKKMEETLEAQNDYILAQIADGRVNDPEAEYISHDAFWADLED